MFLVSSLDVIVPMVAQSTIFNNFAGSMLIGTSITWGNTVDLVPELKTLHAHLVYWQASVEISFFACSNYHYFYSFCKSVSRDK